MTKLELATKIATLDAESGLMPAKRIGCEAFRLKNKYTHLELLGLLDAARDLQAAMDKERLIERSENDGLH